MRSRVWPLFALVALTGAALAQGQDAPADSPERKALDQKLNLSLRDVINRGADLYNAGDPSGCYYLFQGALLTTKPLLDHRPEAQKIIDAGLAEGAKEADFKRRAWALRRALDDVRTQLLLKSEKIDDKKPEDKKPEDKEK